MYNVNTPPESELPSSRTLVRSTLVAAGVALLLLVTIVLPAEYGVDPTGVGRVTGLKRMGEIKMALAKDAAEAEAAEAAAPDSAPAASPADAAPAASAATTNAPTADAPTVSADVGVRSDETQVTLRPGQAA